MSYPKYRAAGVIVGNDWDALVRTVLSYGAATAVVGFNANLSGRENYFLCDGTADDVQIQEAIDYVLGLGLAGKARVVIEAGRYTFTSAVDIEANMTLEVYGEIVKGFAGSPFQIHGVLGTRKTDIDIIGGIYDGDKASFPDDNPFVSLQYADHLLFENMYFYDVADGGDRGYGIRVTVANTVDWVRVLRCRGETSYGLVLLDYTDHFVIAENFCYENEIDIRIVHCQHGVVANNEIYGGPGGGITVMNASTFVHVIGNTVAYKDMEGIEFATADYCSAVGNFLYHNTLGGLKCWDFNYCLIEGNYCIDNACFAPYAEMPVSAQISCYTWRVGEETQYNVVRGNYIHSTGTVAPNVQYGIGEIESGGLGLVDNNTYKDNHISGHAISAGIFVGPNNIYDTKVFSFVQGHDVQDNGFLIDVPGEYARAFCFVPPEVNKVIKLKIHARAEQLEADAMMIGFNMWVGAEGEQFNAHDCTDLAVASTSTNFANTEIIRWTIESACIKLMTGGDSFMVRAIHAVAAGADCATNATIRTVTVEHI